MERNHGTYQDKLAKKMRLPRIKGHFYDKELVRRKKLPCA
jgi:hypothetical protein